MNVSPSLRPEQWRTRAVMGGVLLVIGIALLRAVDNDHWSATVGLALGQVAIGAGAWGITRPILSHALAAVAVPQELTLRPSLMLVVYTFGLIAWSGPLTIERALVAASLTVPGLLLDALLRWYEGQEQRAAAPHTAPKEHSDDHYCS